MTILRKGTLFVSIAVLMLVFSGELSGRTKKKYPPKVQVGLIEREYLVNALIKIADPVLESLSKNQLKERMPVESAPNQEADRKNYIYLEALGRTLAGIAPWLELGPDDSSEGKLREKYILLALQSIRNATDPESVDFMNFTKGGQPLVDAAFLSQAFLRAPTQLWGRLSISDKDHVINALKSTRIITPGYSNWLLFSAEVEAALLKFTGSCDQERLISPEGTYPITGRSIAYRFGAFQVLAKMALLNALPENVSPQQVRAALYALIKRQIEVPGTFDKNGRARGISPREAFTSAQRDY